MQIDYFTNEENTPEELWFIKQRKANYWRGFIVASIIWGIVFAILGNILLNKLESEPDYTMTPEQAETILCQYKAGDTTDPTCKPTDPTCCIEPTQSENIPEQTTHTPTQAPRQATAPAITLIQAPRPIYYPQDYGQAPAYHNGLSSENTQAQQLAERNAQDRADYYDKCVVLVNFLNASTYLNASLSLNDYHDGTWYGCVYTQEKKLRDMISLGIYGRDFNRNGQDLLNQYQ